MRFPAVAASRSRAARILMLIGPAALACCAALFDARPATAQEAEWIWSPKQAAGVPAGTCYFRKTFDLDSPESGEVQITADDAYELFVNNRRVGKGNNWRTLDNYDIIKYLVPGKNTIAVKVVNKAGTAGLAARVVVKSDSETHISHATGESWKTSLDEVAGWTRTALDDTAWLPAHSYGLLGKAAPWNDEVHVAAGAKSGRFQVAKEFRIESVVAPKDTGSVVAMAFDEFGSIVLAREGGPLLIVRDTNHDGIPDTASVYCDKIKNCQGMLPLNGQVFAVGEGPAGTALYRLSEPDANGRLQKIDAIVKFPCPMAEHGPHQPILGPDGLIYIVLGNHSAVERNDEGSPYHHPYEGDLVSPRYEDSGAKGVSVKAPGGTVIRTDINGSFVETFAGGLRNAYDIAFNRQGELFTHDSDMEWDVGLPWYRPTRVNHLTAGSEFGWRGGWAVWPDYFVDSLGSVVDTGRGSPTGMMFYNHYAFPARYQDVMFVGDWSRGRILLVRMKPSGGSYTGESEVFVEGRPLNITDLAVGPDGWLYFCTGGRGTEGGIYRVTWHGKPSDEMLAFKAAKGIDAAVRQPQLDSAWARQRIATVRQQLGDQWGPQLVRLAENKAARPEDRIRALDLMQLAGPFPDDRLLLVASADANDELRAKAAFMMGIHFDEAAGARLVEMLADKNLAVERTACEALARAGHHPPLKALLPVLASPDRSVAWSARRVLEQLPVNQWQDEVLASDNKRVFIQGSIALMALGGDQAAAKAIVAHGLKMLGGFVSDDDFVDLLRVFQLALVQGKLTGDDLPELRDKLAEEYPAHEWRMNRELVRLLVYLQAKSVRGRMLDQLKLADLPLPDKLHIALHARFLTGWTTDQKFELLKFLEASRAVPGGHNLTTYIENISRDFYATFTPEERGKVLADAQRWPASALAVLAGLPNELSDDMVEQLIQLDGPIAQADNENARRLSVGIVAVLGNSGQPRAMKHLRNVFENEPNRRSLVAMGLAQHPEGENWPYLLRSLPVVEGVYAQEVLTRLADAPQKPDKPEPIRQVILQGLKLGDDGGKTAVALLEKWSGKKLGKPDDAVNVALAAWQAWFAETYPGEPEAKLPSDTIANKWTLDDLTAFLTSPEGARGNAQRGAAVFTKAQCIRCHKFGEHGEGIGPDLTNVSRRFQRKEIIESILFPSQVIADQYASKIIHGADGRVYAGLVSEGPGGSLTVTQSDTTKVTLTKDQIESVAASKKSMMPEGLLNTLSQEDVADLFAYLAKPPVTVITQRPGKLGK